MDGKEDLRACGLPFNSKHLIGAGMGSMLSYDGLADAMGGGNGLCFRPLAPRVEMRHKILWRKLMPTSPSQALIDELARLC